MGRQKKTATMFRKEIQELLESLGEDSKQRIPDDHRKYHAALQLKNRVKQQQQEILPIEQQHILNDDELHKTIFAERNSSS